MGHIIQYNVTGPAANKCFNFIYSFHMGFFFFISGLTASLSIENNKWENSLSFIRKKSRQLILPFFVWGGLISLISMGSGVEDFPHRLLSIIKNPCDNAPWFLCELFVIQIVFFVFCAITSNKVGKYALPFSLILSIPAIVLLLELKKSLIGLGYNWITPQYLFMFILGVFVKLKQLKPNLEKVLSVVSLLVFIVVVPFFDFNMENSLRREIIKLIVSISFSICAYFTIKNSYHILVKQVTSFVNYLGSHTLEIYVTHFYVIKISVLPWIITNGINSFPLFLIVLLVSLPVSYLVIQVSNAFKLIPTLSLLLYGK